MSTDDVQYQERDSIAWITMNRPERHNAFNADMIGRLADAVERAGRSADVGVVVLTGAGDKAFSSGGFVRDLSDLAPERARALYDNSRRAYEAIRRIRQPVIAAVNGLAFGGGHDLIIAADLAIASDQARFGHVGPKVGSAHTFGGTNFLSMSIGEKRAKEVMYLCRPYTAAEALEMGLVNRVVAHAELTNAVNAMCADLLEMSATYLEVTKVTSNVWWDMLAPAFSHAAQINLRLSGGVDMTEGANAFLEKRKPQFRKPKI